MRSADLKQNDDLKNIGDDWWSCPGFVDIQVNGFAGIDFNLPETTIEEIGRAIDVIVLTGVTRCLPTVITGSTDDMLTCLGNLRRAQKTIARGRVIAGFHVEGPHIGAEDGPRGAHPKHWVRRPDLNEYQRWQDVTDGNIRMVTVSPHWENSAEYTAALVRDGVTVAIGHTGATSEQIRSAVDAGATISTHLGNAAHSELPRRSNYLWDQLAEDRLSASFIVDGWHLNDAFLRTALRAKTVERSVLVTDAASPAGAVPGRYRLGEQDADLLEDGRVVLRGTTKLAGSALKMNHAIANVMRTGGISLEDAIRMATVNPARVVHLPESRDRVEFRLADGRVVIEKVQFDGD